MYTKVLQGCLRGVANWQLMIGQLYNTLCEFSSNTVDYYYYLLISDKETKDPFKVPYIDTVARKPVET